MEEYAEAKKKDWQREAYEQGYINGSGFGDIDKTPEWYNQQPKQDESNT
jgi:hypothetical protein